MSFFNKNISRKIANQKLETKLLLSTIGIDLLFLFFFLVAAFSIITSRYHKLLYQSMQSSSSLVSYEFTNRLEDLVTMTNIVRSDSTVQSTLDEIYQPQEDYAVHYYSDIYSALQKHYLEYRQPYLKMAAISCPRFITYTNENIACRPDADLTKELIALAEAGEGSPVWVTSHAEDHGIFLVREIKKIKNLRLDNLGTLIINVNLGDLVTEMSKISNEYKDVKVLAQGFNGGTMYQLLTVKKEVKSPADMKGLTIWCEADWNGFVRECGATPVNTPFSEVYSSLQKNMYDGMLIPTETLQSCNFAEVCKYCVKLNLCYTSAPGHLMNLDTWNSLPEDIQQIIDSEEIRSVVETANVEGFKASEKGAMAWAEENFGTKEVVLSDDQRAEFIALVQKANLAKAAELDAQGLPGTEIVESLAKWSEEWEANK